MENSSKFKEKFVAHETKVFIIICAGITYFAFRLIFYINYIRYGEEGILIDTFQYILVGEITTGIIIGPILLLIASYAYLTKASALARIPRNTTLYESITQPTIQYGPLRLIMPVWEDEIVDEMKIVEIDP